MTDISASSRKASISEMWVDRARSFGKWLLVAAIAFVLGMFVFAPMRSSAQPSNLPVSYLALPTGIVGLEAPEGSSLLLPVRIADTSQARLIGFRDVGEDALANQFLLYAQNRQTAGRTSYSIEKVRVPLEFAAFDAEGNLVSVASSTVGTARISIPEPHRWLLTAKTGTFKHYGIDQGMKLDPESVRKINL